MSASWVESLRELRVEFVRKCPGTLAEMGALLEKAAAGPGDAGSLEALARKFHTVAGTAGTFGFPEATDLSRTAEALIETDRVARGRLSAASSEQLGALLLRLGTVLAAGAGPAPAAPGRAVPASRQARVVLADDDPAFLDELQRALEHHGIGAVAAPTPDALVDAFREDPPDGAVIGAQFGGVPGSALVERLRALPGGDATALFVVGQRSGFLDRVGAIQAGADATFDRPLDEEAFVRRLGVLLERERAEPSRILSVEDDPDHAAFVRTVLESGGHVVKTCEDPKRFESDAIAFRPDLVLLDVNLPGVSGHDLARLLRQNEAYAALPVVFLTAETREEVRIRSIRAGGDDHLVKPVAPCLLLSTVTARLERARTLKGLLTRDGLTGLTNHTTFLEGLKTTWKRFSRTPGRGLALVSLDLDHFKSVNDQHGHPAGDRVLAALGVLLRRRLRATDLIGRLGGEEFAVVLEDLDRDEAVSLMERILADFAAIDHASAEGAFRVTFSAGISFLKAGTGVEEWRTRADEALYAAKRGGRARIVLAPAG